MTTETQRDLHADLAICSAATEGPWKSKTNRHPEIGGRPWGWIDAGARQVGTWSGSRNDNYDADTAFITEARTGWPHALERAINAEAEIDRLRGEVDALEQIDLFRDGQAESEHAENERLYAALRDIDTHIGGSNDPIPHIVATLKRVLPEYAEESGDPFADEEVADDGTTQESV